MKKKNPMAYDGYKLTIDLTLSNLKIAPEYKWSKEYVLWGSEHFLIIIEDKREGPTKKQQRWSRQVAITNIPCKIFETKTNKRLVWCLKKEMKIDDTSLALGNKEAQ